MKLSSAWKALLVFLFTLGIVEAQAPSGTEPANTAESSVKDGQKIPQGQVGLCIAVRGQATIANTDGKRARLRIRTPIYEGSTITTGIGTLVQLEFLDESKVIIAGETDYTVDKLSYDGTADSRSEATVNNGGIAFFAGKVGEIAPENYKVRTAMATVGIRGTSGDLVTADGTNPDNPQKLEIMKTGGKALTVGFTPDFQAKQGLTLDPLLIEVTGTGFTIDQLGTADPITWPISPLREYEEEQEQKRIDNDIAQDDPAGGDLDEGRSNDLGGTPDDIRLVTTPVQDIFRTEGIAREVIEVNSGTDSDDEAEAIVVTPDADYSGRSAGISEGSGFSSTAQYGSAPSGVGFIVDSLSQNFLWPSPTFSGTVYGSVSHTNIFPAQGGRLGQFLYDNLGDFFIFNDFVEGNSYSQSIMSYIGRPLTSGLPESGVYIYGKGGITGILGTHPVTSLLVRANEFSDPGFNSNSVVDYEAMKIVGRTQGFYDSEVFITDPVLAIFNGSAAGYTALSVAAEPAFVAFYGSLGSDGSISNLQLFRNLGLLPDYVINGENLMTPGSAPSFQTDLLTGFSGQGQIYGRDHQGVGVHANNGSDGHFIAGGFRNTGGALPSNNGTYEGWAPCLVASGTGFTTLTENAITNMSADIDFGVNGTQSLSGSITVDIASSYFEFEIGNLTFAGDGESIFANLQNSGGTSFDELSGLNTNASFLGSMDLPSVLDSGEQTLHPEDVLWGTFNVVGTNEIFPGLHNFWVIGIPTAIDAQAFQTWEQLNYQSTQSPIFFYLGSMKRTFAQEVGSPFNHPVMTDTGLFSLSVDFQTGSGGLVHGIALFPSGSIALMNGSLSGGTPNQIQNSNNFALLSLNGENGSDQIFSTAFSASGLSSFWQGRLTGSDANSMFLQFSRQSSSPNPDAFSYGAAVARRISVDTQGSYPITFFHGKAYGLFQGSSPSGNVQDPTGDSDLLGFEVDFAFEKQSTFSPITFVSAGTVGQPTLGSFNGSPSISVDQASPVSTVIDKNAFVTTFGSQTGPFIANSGTFSLPSTDPENSIFVGLPGLEAFEHVGWGIFSLQNGGVGTDRGFGYFGFGESNALSAAISSLGAQSGTVAYQGPAIATVFTPSGGNPSMVAGTSTMNVNFDNGSITGNLNFGTSGTVNLSAGAGAINAQAGFSGNAALSTGGAGQFSGHFFGNNCAEHSAAFRVVDTNADKAMAGAFAGQR